MCVYVYVYVITQRNTPNGYSNSKTGHHLHIKQDIKEIIHKSRSIPHNDKSIKSQILWSYNVSSLVRDISLSGPNFGTDGEWSKHKNQFNILKEYETTKR